MLTLPPSCAPCARAESHARRWCDRSDPCGRYAFDLYVVDRVRPKDSASPRATRRTDDLPPNLEHATVAYERSLPIHANTKETSHDARHGEMVQQPEGLRFHSAR